MAMKTQPGDTRPARAAKREWTRPAVVCFETRPEVTAYAGDGGGPWSVR